MFSQLGQALEEGQPRRERGASFFQNAKRRLTTHNAMLMSRSLSKFSFRVPNKHGSSTRVGAEPALNAELSNINMDGVPARLFQNSRTEPQRINNIRMSALN